MSSAKKSLRSRGFFSEVAGLKKAFIHDGSEGRTSHPEVFFKIGALQNFAKFTRKQLYQSLISIKLQDSPLPLYQKRDSGTGVFLWNLRNFSKHLFYRTPPRECFLWSGNYIVDMTNSNTVHEKRECQAILKEKN